MEKKTVTLIGATGLIGSHLLEILVNDPEFEMIKIASRRPLPLVHPKITVLVVDFADQESLKQAITGSNVVFCTVGTTQKKVKGDREAYRKVDFAIPVTTAKLCAELGIQHFSLVSSVGADSQSHNFYLRLKGEVEDAIQTINIPSISIFRPSMLLGKRQESRPGEKMGQYLVKPFSFLIPSNYKPIQAEAVAKAMVKVSKTSGNGYHIFYYKEMMEC